MSDRVYEAELEAEVEHLKVAMRDLMEAARAHADSGVLAVNEVLDANVRLASLLREGQYRWTGGRKRVCWRCNEREGKPCGPDCCLAKELAAHDGNDAGRRGGAL